MDVLTANQSGSEIDIPTRENDDKVFWYENDGDQNFTEHTIISDANNTLFVYADDIDGDGDKDVLSFLGDGSIGWFENSVSCPAGFFDCNGECGGLDVTSCLDCNGTMHGYAVLDDCGLCVSGTTGLLYDNSSCGGCMDVIAENYNPSYTLNQDCNYQKHNITDGNGSANLSSAVDLDGDGDMDILGGSGWNENDGSGIFYERTFSNSCGTSGADLDGDGDMDILCSSSWYENDGNENFEFGNIIYELSSGESVREVITSDLDSDGDIDVLTASEGSYGDYEAGKIAWHENLGGGSFVPHVIANPIGECGIPQLNEYTCSPYYKSIAVVDINDDGFKDVISFSAYQSVQDQVGAGLYWYKNDGNQNFTNHVIDNNLYTNEPKSAYGEDVDNDGDMDIIVIDLVAVSWYENDGDEGFSTHLVQTSNYPGGPEGCGWNVSSFRQGMVVEDIDADGNVDVLTSHTMLNGNHAALLWLRNDGTGNFTEYPIIFEVTANILAADFDSDGDIDLASYTYVDDYYNAWYENNITCADGFFDCNGKCGGDNFDCVDCNGTIDGFAVLDDCGSCIGGATGLEYDNASCTGCMDPISATYDPANIFSVPEDCIYQAKTVAENMDGLTDIYIADINGDGQLDVISAASEYNMIAWHENIVDDFFGNQFITRVITVDAINARSVYAIDIDKDGSMDVLSASQNDNKISLYHNDGYDAWGQLQFEEQIITQDAFGADIVKAVDIDGDGYRDIISSSIYDNKITWFKNDGNYNGSEDFAESFIIDNDANSVKSIHLLDFESDEDIDILTAQSNGVMLYLNNGGSFSKIYISAQAADDVYGKDINSDGYVDILVSSILLDQLLLLINTSDGDGISFAEPQYIDMVAGSNSIRINNLDADGIEASDVDGSLTPSIPYSDNYNDICNEHPFLV